MTIRYHVSTAKLANGALIIPSCTRYAANEACGRPVANLLLIARMRLRWREAPLNGRRSMHDQGMASWISDILRDGHHVWMTDTLDEAEEIASCMATKPYIYAVDADSVEYRVEDNGVDGGRAWPTAPSAVVVAKVA